MSLHEDGRDGFHLKRALSEDRDPAVSVLGLPLEVSDRQFKQPCASYLVVALMAEAGQMEVSSWNQLCVGVAGELYQLERPGAMGNGLAPAA